MSNEQNPNESPETASLRRVSTGTNNTADESPETANLGRMNTGTGTTDDAAERQQDDPYSLDGERVKTRRRPKE